MKAGMFVRAGLAGEFGGSLTSQNFSSLSVFPLGAAFLVFLLLGALPSSLETNPPSESYSVSSCALFPLAICDRRCWNRGVLDD